MPLIQRLAIAIALSLSLETGEAIAQPEYKRSPWQTFGTFEVSWAEPEGPRVLRMTNFSNGEFMAEVEAKGMQRKQRLQVQPSGLALYSGLSDDESPEFAASNNPFMFLDYGFYYPASALIQAYPLGAASVPDIETDTSVVLEKQYPATLTVVRHFGSEVRFRLSIRSEVSMTMQGVWDGERPKPLPDSLSIATWRHASSATVPTLGEARSLSREQVRAK